MSLAHLYTAETSVIESHETIRHAATLLRNRATTELIIAKRQGEGAVPIGILSDRDLVIEILSPGVDPESVTVGDLMIEPPYTVSLNQTPSDAVHLMSEHGLRSIPVTDDNGYLVGILRVENLLGAIIREVAAVTNILNKAPRQHLL